MKCGWVSRQGVLDGDTVVREFGLASSVGWGWLQVALRLGSDGKANWPWRGEGRWLESHSVLREESEGG